MKKFTLLCCLLWIAFSASAQFEGTIKWSMKMDITDPATKAKMESAQQKMNDPATQAKMKEMEAKMNDPQFKAMMEANPAMKAQMENMMKNTQGAGGMNPTAMMPTGMVVRVKGTSSLTVMQGGMMDGMEVLHQKDKPSVRIDRKNKTWSALPGGNGQGKQGEGIAANVTKSTDKMTILGYSCTKYIVETTDKGKTIKEIVWATNDLKDVDLKSMSRQRSPSGRPFFSEKIDGVPLRIEMHMDQGDMVMECTEIKRESISAADMTVPADFKETKMGMGFN